MSDTMLVLLVNTVPQKDQKLLPKDAVPPIALL